MRASLIVAMALLVSRSPLPAPAAEPETSGIDSLVTLLREIDDPDFQLDLLTGIQDGLKGRRRVAMPEDWPEVYQGRLATSTNSEVRRRARALAIIFGDHAALLELKKTVGESSRDLPLRREALASLLDAHVDDLATDLRKWMADPGLRADVIRGLAEYDDPTTAVTVLDAYASFNAQEKRFALDTLGARPSWAQALLAAVASGRVQRQDLNAETIRKLRLLNDEQVNQAIQTHWGVTRPTAAERLALIQRYKRQLTENAGEAADPYHGRAVFANTCQQCHTLFGVGATVGPDITGSNRNNLDYLLINVVDPNAMVGKDYQAWNFFTQDGQVHIGLITAETNRTITLQTSTKTITIPRDELEDQQLSDVSMMPEGLLDQLRPDQVRDLVAYLASPVQLPLLAVRGSTHSLNDALNLAGWEGDWQFWRWQSQQISVVTDQPLQRVQELASPWLVEDFVLEFDWLTSQSAGESGVLLRRLGSRDGAAGDVAVTIDSAGALQLSLGEQAPLTQRITPHTDVSPNQWYPLRLTRAGRTVVVQAGDNEATAFEIPTAPQRAILGFVATRGFQGAASFRNIRLSVPGLDPDLGAAKPATP